MGKYQIIRVPGRTRLNAFDRVIDTSKAFGWAERGRENKKIIWLIKLWWFRLNRAIVIVSLGGMDKYKEWKKEDWASRQEDVRLAMWYIRTPYSMRAWKDWNPFAPESFDDLEPTPASGKKGGGE